MKRGGAVRSLRDSRKILRSWPGVLPSLGVTGGRDIDKADKLKAMGLRKILELNFKGDKYRSGTIRNWIDGKKASSNDETSGSVREQLRSYVLGPTVPKEIASKNFRAFAVVIVGSRQILVREMDRRGDWVDEFQLELRSFFQLNSPMDLRKPVM